ncbi:MAG: hypothetical protein Q8N99_03975 [Nanoarchaeota archaeon]|nr:hypothetical protein [Nanoarchaeota archaeon]
MVKKDSILSLIFGILSLIFWLLPILGLPISIIGIVFSVKDMKKKNKYAMAALICSIIGLVLTSINAGIGAYLGITGQHNLVNQILK